MIVGDCPSLYISPNCGDYFLLENKAESDAGLNFRYGFLWKIYIFYLHYLHILVSY